jgi:hypothetical protein
MKKSSTLPEARFRVEGYSYRPVEKTEPDDRYSIQHLLIKDESGQVIKPDFTPWCYMSKTDVENYVFLGHPTRNHEYRPLSSTDLRKMRNSSNR